MSDLTGQTVTGQGAETASQQPQAGAGTQTTQPGWVAAVKPELREFAAKYPAVSDAVRALSELDQRSQRMIELPAEGASDEDRAAFLRRLGRPDSHEGYDLQIEGKQEGMAETEKWFRQAAYDAGLSADQARRLFGKINDQQKSVMEQMKAQESERQAKAQTAYNEGMAKLQIQYGSALDGKLARAKSAVRLLGGEELAKVIEDSGLGNNLAMVNAMVKLAEIVGEDPGISGTPHGKPNVKPGLEFGDTM